MDPVDSNNNSMNTSVNNCTNELCIDDNDYIDLVADSLKPDETKWFFISLHVIVFICGIFGNSLVCLAVYRNKTMRTVTNYYIVNLAIADLMVLIFCLPTTVVWDVYETWFFGELSCKIITYLQTVSVSVSIFTLTFISIDRWRAICYPLKFKSTTKKAKKRIFCIWLISLTLDCPEVIFHYLQPQEHLKVKTVFFTQCKWSQDVDRIFTFFKMIFNYFGPLIFISIAHYQIFSVLWISSIYQINEITCSTNENFESQLMSRRKAAKLLIIVVFFFTICYLPVHLLDILRHLMDIPSNKYTIALSLFAHWLCYANSVINPVIYNFMSGKFRKEFLRSFYLNKNNPSINNPRGFNKTSVSPAFELRSQTHISRSPQLTDNNNHYESLQNSNEFIPLNNLNSYQ